MRLKEKKMSELRKGYYYLHTNGSTIWKPSTVTRMDPEYFNSPFVVKVWEINSKESFEKMNVEINTMKASKG